MSIEHLKLKFDIVTSASFSPEYNGDNLVSQPYLAEDVF